MNHCIKTSNEYAGVDTFQPLGIPNVWKKKIQFIIANKIRNRILYGIIYLNWKDAHATLLTAENVFALRLMIVLCQNPYLNEDPHFFLITFLLCLLFCAQSECFSWEFFPIFTFPTNCPLLHFKWLKQSVQWQNLQKCKAISVSRNLAAIQQPFQKWWYDCNEFGWKKYISRRNTILNMEYSKCLLSRKIRLWFRVKSNISHITYVDWQFSSRFSCIRQKSPSHFVPLRFDCLAWIFIHNRSLNSIWQQLPFAIWI